MLNSITTQWGGKRHYNCLIILFCVFLNYLTFNFIIFTDKGMVVFKLMLFKVLKILLFWLSVLKIYFKRKEIVVVRGKPHSTPNQEVIWPLWTWFFFCKVGSRVHQSMSLCATVAEVMGKGEWKTKMKKQTNKGEKQSKNSFRLEAIEREVKN